MVQIKTLIINHIDRVVKHIYNDKTNNRMCIRIDYNNDKDMWYKYSFYYNKNYRSEYNDIKELKTIEQVKDEIIAIYQAYGSIDYMMYNYDKEVENFNVYN